MRIGTLGVVPPFAFVFDLCVFAQSTLSCPVLSCLVLSRYFFGGKKKRLPKGKMSCRVVAMVICSQQNTGKKKKNERKGMIMIIPSIFFFFFFIIVIIHCQGSSRRLLANSVSLTNYWRLLDSLPCRGVAWRVHKGSINFSMNGRSFSIRSVIKQHERTNRMATPPAIAAIAPASSPPSYY